MAEKADELAEKAKQEEAEKKKEKENNQNYNKGRNSSTHKELTLNDIFKSCPLESFCKYSTNKDSSIFASPSATNNELSFLKKINGLIGVSIPKETDKKAAFLNNKARYDQVDEKYKKYIMSQKNSVDIKISIIQATALSALDKSLQLLNSNNNKNINIFVDEMNESLKNTEHILKKGILPKNLLLNMIYSNGKSSYTKDTLKQAIADKKSELKNLYYEIGKSDFCINSVGDNALKNHFDKIKMTPQTNLQRY